MDTTTTAVGATVTNSASRKRKRSSKPTSAAPTHYPTAAADTLDIDSLIATLTGDNAVSDCVSTPSPTTTTTTTQTHYYMFPTEPPSRASPAPPPPLVEPYIPTPLTSLPPSQPRLLLRQSYKVANQADAVVGLESTHGFVASIYLVNSQISITLTREDLLGLKSVGKPIDRYLHKSVPFQPMYLDTLLVEPCCTANTNVISLCNYQLQSKSRQPCESDILKQTSTVQLQSTGWSSLKKLFECLETYYNICLDCSPLVRSLVARYSRHFTKHYRTRALLTHNPNREDIVRLVSSDLPAYLMELQERHLTPVEDHCDYNQLRYAMLPWVDAEVRRYCAPNIIDSVVDNVLYLLK